jgi:hypothetical protein
MFAPTPIQIRYGEDGSLAAGAAAAGRGSNYSRQKAMDMQFINGEADRRQQSEEFAMQQQANALQSAQQLAVSRVQGNPTNSTSMARGNSPFTQAVQFAKANALQGAIASGDIAADDPLATLAVNSPDVNADQLLRLIDQRKKQTTDDQTNKKDVQAKQAVIDASANVIDPEDANLLKGYVSDPKMTIDGIRKVITESQRKLANKQKLTQGVQGRALSQQLTQGRGMATQALAQAKAIEKDHPEINFNGPPTQFGPDEADSLSIYVQHQKLVAQAQQIQARGEALAGGNAAYTEGQVLHSPSTGRIFKVVNGQLVEVTQNASAGE